MNSVEHVKSEALLSLLEMMKLETVMKRNIELMAKELGCTSFVEHVIVTDSVSYIIHIDSCIQ